MQGLEDPTPHKRHMAIIAWVTGVLFCAKLDVQTTPPQVQEHLWRLKRKAIGPPCTVLCYHMH